MIHCRHFNTCSGCTLDEQALRPPVYEKALRFFTSHGVKDVELAAANLTKWRVRAKLAVRGQIGNPVIGLFKERSHDVLEIPFCKVHNPLINESIELIKQSMIKLHIEPYDEALHKGLLRYVQLVVNRQTNTVQLSLIVNSQEGALKLANFLQNEKPELWHSIWINVNDGQTNRILGDEWIFVSGKRDFKEKILHQDIYLSPAGFSQANMDLFESIVQAIVDNVDVWAHVIEYYAGVGSIGLPVAAKCRSLKAVEFTKEAKHMFEKAGVKNTSYFVGPVKDFTHLINDADTIIVDPPRKGLDPFLLKALKEVKGKKLIYVSCGYESFEKDAISLIESGYRLTYAKTYLLFPGSNHIETLAIFNS
jgi:23S rRNA (uracil1939-C5)-methyltransferase